MMAEQSLTGGPVVSVVIVNWNTASLLRDCLASVPQGFTTSSFEVFVVDNGSTDGSQDVVRTEFPHVTLIENGRNLGFAAANNAALRKARGEFFLLLNSDTVMTEGAIEALITYMRATSACGFCGPQLLNADGSRQNSIANFPSLITEIGQKGLLRILAPDRYYSKKTVHAEPKAVESLVGACLLARRSMTDQIGLFDESFFFFFEETEWCLRGRKNGWSCVLFPTAKVYHLQGQTAKQVPVAVRIEYWRSRYTYFQKHFNAATCVVLALGLLVRMGGTALLNVIPAIFSRCARHKIRLSLAIALWHLRGRPAKMGLSVPACAEPASAPAATPSKS